MRRHGHGSFVALVALVLGMKLAVADPPLASSLLAPQLVVDQVGYPLGGVGATAWDADAFLLATTAEAATARQPLRVVDAASNALIATATAAAPRRDLATGDWIATIRLPPLAAGRYRLLLGALRSAAFSVAPLAGDKRATSGPSAGLYDELARALLRAFYLQRCGVALDDSRTEARTGARHAACHLQDATLAPSASAAPQKRVATGGWHDAGDFGKYIATTAVAIARFLHAYERDPLRHGFDDLGIPESGNGVPDLLDEMQIGLDWMLTMQRSDGAVYRKLGGAEWSKRVVPERDTQPRFIYGVTSPETAKAAAAWALAARLYRKSDPKAATRYLTAARRAWAWLEDQPESAGQIFNWREGDDSGSGPYKSSKTDAEASLTYDRDDRLWAATELALTTGEAKWFVEVRRLAKAAPVNLFEWKDASSLALSYFLWHPSLAQAPAADRADLALAAQLAKRFTARAAAPLAQTKRSGYRIANARFVWGSNKMTAEEGILLCTAYGLTGKRELLAAARDQLHYLLGRNHFATAFVSGAGERAVRHPTHLYSEAAGLELPGLFVGGPNDAEQSKIAPQFKGPLSWIDDARSYATNEFAIDYNASLYGLLAELARDCAR